jgi:hypothetical protein
MFNKRFRGNNDILISWKLLTLGNSAGGSECSFSASLVEKNGTIWRPVPYLSGQLAQKRDVLSP